jgi:hypothetical protein
VPEGEEWVMLVLALSPYVLETCVSSVQVLAVLPEVLLVYKTDVDITSENRMHLFSSNSFMLPNNKYRLQLMHSHAGQLQALL